MSCHITPALKHTQRPRRPRRKPRSFQGKYPDGLKLVEDDELREFIQLCISHTPDARPDTRKLLKHSFFEGCRGKGGDASRLDPDPPRDLSTLLGARLRLALRITAFVGVST